MTICATEIFSQNFCFAKILAERLGFEPKTPQSGVTVFETAAFDHSATSPYRRVIKFYAFTVDKLNFSLPIKWPQLQSFT